MPFELPSTPPMAAKKTGTIAFRVADSDGVCKTLEGDVPYRKGDVICTNVDPKGRGESWPVERDKFEKKYQPVRDGDGPLPESGTAKPKGNPTLVWEITSDMTGPDGKAHVPVGWAENGELTGRPGADYLVCYGPGDYGIIDKKIFQQTYEVPNDREWTESETEFLYNLCDRVNVPLPDNVPPMMLPNEEAAELREALSEGRTHGADSASSAT